MASKEGLLCVTLLALLLCVQLVSTELSARHDTQANEEDGHRPTLDRHIRSPQGGGVGGGGVGRGGGGGCNGRGPSIGGRWVYAAEEESGHQAILDRHIRSPQGGGGGGGGSRGGSHDDRWGNVFGINYQSDIQKQKFQAR